MALFYQLIGLAIGLVIVIGFLRIFSIDATLREIRDILKKKAGPQ